MHDTGRSYNMSSLCEMYFVNYVFVIVKEKRNIEYRCPTLLNNNNGLSSIVAIRIEKIERQHRSQ